VEDTSKMRFIMKFSRFFRRGRDIAQESSVPVLSRGRGQRWKNIRLALIVVIAVGVSEYKSVLRHGGRIVSQFVATRDYVTGHKVTDDLRICLTSPSSKQEVEQLCEQVRADYRAVREAFEVDVTGPIGLSRLQASYRAHVLQPATI
jgi:hypothetical protein